MLGSRSEGDGLDYRYSISLRIRHPHLDLSEAAGVFGLETSNVWLVGERRKTPKGTLLDGVRSDSFWTARIEDGSSTTRSLPLALLEVVERLRIGAAFLNEVTEGGGRCELFIGWFFDEGNSGDVLGFDLLQSLADLKVDLSFDVYGRSCPSTSD